MCAIVVFCGWRLQFCRMHTEGVLCRRQRCSKHRMMTGTFLYVIRWSNFPLTTQICHSHHTYASGAADKHASTHQQADVFVLSTAPRFDPSCNHCSGRRLYATCVCVCAVRLVQRAYKRACACQVGEAQVSGARAWIAVPIQWNFGGMDLMATEVVNMLTGLIVLRFKSIYIFNMIAYNTSNTQHIISVISTSSGTRSPEIKITKTNKKHWTSNLHFILRKLFDKR